MREADRQEIHGVRGHLSASVLAYETVIAAAMGIANIEHVNGKPASIVGATPMHPGVWSVWSYGTDDWGKACLRQTRWALRVLKPLLIKRGCHRLQCESREDHFDAHNWLRSCGAKPEGVLSGFGCDGSDYIQFVWRN